MRKAWSIRNSPSILGKVQKVRSYRSARTIQVPNLIASADKTIKLFRQLRGHAHFIMHTIAGSRIKLCSYKRLKSLTTTSLTRIQCDTRRKSMQRVCLNESILVKICAAIIDYLHLMAHVFKLAFKRPCLKH